MAYLGQNCRFCQKLGLGAVYFGLFLSSANGKAYSAVSIRSMLAGGPAQAPTDSKQLTERSTLLATVGAPRRSRLGPLATTAIGSAAGIPGNRAGRFVPARDPRTSAANPCTNDLVGAGEQIGDT